MRPLTDKQLALIMRKGRFRLSYRVLIDNPDSARAVFGQCVIVRATAHFIDDTIFYDAYSPLFYPIEQGEDIPEYLWLTTKDENGKIIQVVPSIVRWGEG